MPTPASFTRGFVTIAVGLLAVALSAQTAAPPQTFKPEVGQAGKDVVWVPTADTLVKKMLDMAKLTAQDYVIDLGSGDGRTVIAAAKRGATALGIEYNPDMVELSRKNAAAAGVSAKATFKEADIFVTDYSRATVLTLFLMPDINVKLRPTILNMKPGTRVVSNSFDMGEWEPDETASIEEECTSWCTAFLWIVPAKVDGSWASPQGDLTITQTFQRISGTLGTAPITNGKLRGSEISFTANGTTYTGRVNGSSMQGTTSARGTWAATRR